jgi:hypothetical protein
MQIDPISDHYESPVEGAASCELLSAIRLQELELMYSSDTKKAARQIVRESFDRILAGTYQIPLLEEMISILERNFQYCFDEYKVKQRIKRLHWGWGKTQVIDELDRQKRHYENELRVNLQVAALNTIDEIENLIKSLRQMITEWKIENL